MQNVLDGTKEAELQIFENEHFKLGKDYKFNEGDLKTLWLLAIPKTVFTKSIRSIRDLTGDHLPMLKSILTESYKAIHERYGLPSSMVSAYFHYLPSYWCLHAHFVHIDKANNDKEYVSLEQVIANLEMNANYYKLATLQYTIGDQSDLFKALKEEGILEDYVDPKDLKKPVGETEED